MSLKLDYPPTIPSDTVTLNSPELGDSKQYDQRIIFMRSMNGALSSYKRTPSKRTFLWGINNIPDATIITLRAFFITSNGKEIRVTDHNGNKWDGYVLNNPFEDMDHGLCKNSTTIQFVGELV